MLSMASLGFGGGSVSNLSNDVGTRFYDTTAIDGYGGVISLESSIVRKDSTGGDVDVYIGRWMGNSGELTITWDIQDGSRTVANAVSGYAGLSKTVTFSDGEYGWKRVQVPLQTWTLTDWEYVVFRITNVTINNAEPFYNSDANVCYLRIDDESIVNSSRLFCDKDAAGASDSNSGTAASPFLTLQKLSDEMVSQGKDGYVVAASTPYEELSKVSGAAVGGMTFNRTSGGSNYNDFLRLDGLTTAGARVTTAFSGAPVFDNDYQDSVSPGNSAAGLHIYAGDSIWVTDIELQNCVAGVTTNPGGSGVTKILMERVSSHGHVGGDNIAGFRFDNSYQCVIHNCRAYKNFDNRSGNASNPYSDSDLTAGTFNGQTVYAHHNGYQSFGAETLIVEYSYFYQLRRAVYAKEQRDDIASLPQSVWVRNCRFETIDNACYDSHNQGTRPGAHEIAFSFNVAYQVSGLVSMLDGGATGGQADGAYIFNNTGELLDVFYSDRGTTGVRLSDNIMSTANPNVGNATPKVISLREAENGTDDTVISFTKNNTFHFSSREFIVDADGGNEVSETTLSGWQTVHTDHPTPSTTYLTEDPEENSTEADPGITDAANGDFTLSSYSTDSWLGGHSRGAYTDSDELTVIGNY